MATLFGVNATLALNSTPVVKVPPGQGGGMVRVMFDSFSYGAGGSGLADVINLGVPLPPGAMITEVVVNNNAWGGSGAINLGWAVSAGDADVANATGFFSALAVSSAGTTALSLTGNNAAVGLFKLFSSAPASGTNIVSPSIQVQAVVSTAGAAQVSTLKVAIYFIVY